MKKTLLFLVLTICLMATSAMAHSLWINNFESQVHQPPHAMVSLGWGHTLPVDDIMTSPNGRVEVQNFDLYDPALAKTALHRPPFKMSTPDQVTANFDLFNADLATQKIALKKESKPGVYQLSAVSKPAFYVQFIDKKGNKRLKMKPMDQVKNIDKVLMAVKYQAFAKSYLTVGEWQQPKPLGHGLEIIPQTDLSNLHVGDLVEVEVLFYGEPLNTSAKSMEQISAVSSSFGQSDGFFIGSYIKKGKAQFRVQSSGQWMINVVHKDDVTPDGSLKDLVGKAQQVYHGASLTFNVK